jgi:hypothetical protein
MRLNQMQAARLSETVGRQRLLGILRDSQAELEVRIARYTRGGRGAGTFTLEQMNTALVQVRAVLRDLQPAIAAVVLENGEQAAAAAVDHTQTYLNVAETSFAGIVQPLAFNEAKALDVASEGARASILQRLGTSGEGARNGLDETHRAKAGILERYGTGVIGQFEARLQQGVIQRKSWSDMERDITAESPFLQESPRYWAERIVRTETMGAYNRAAAETHEEVGRQVGGGKLLRILSATFDDRTSADSYAVHGQIRRIGESFDTWQGKIENPPARPNDREIVVLHKITWPLPKYLTPRTDAEVLARWRSEGRKGSPPPRPLLSTVPRSEIGAGRRR